MRKYLVPVEGDGGNFLAGLVSAGVPDGVLWAPARVLAKGQNNTGVATLRDKLWLPTEREMFGKRTYSATSETEQNQARLEYYDTPGWGSLHVKYYLQATADWYWGSSPYFNDSIAFCYDFVGYSNRAVASTPGGVVPAFCVQ
jgi:hypothetical protein